MKQTLLPLLAACAMCACTATPEASDYAVVAGPGIADDPQWNSVIEALCESHPGARVIHYRDTVSEALPALREAAPRYVAFIEQPEQVGRAYIIALNRMSREVDDDIYADYLWGVITGYDAEAALRMVCDAREPLVIRSAVSTLREVGSGKWFDSFAYVDDRNAGICGEKKPGADSVSHYRTERLLEDGRPDLLRSFCDFYAAYDPDLITTASHATERNLEMPFSVGNLRARDGALYADFPEGPEALKESGKRRVFLPIGNCLIGNVNNTRESMAIAWMNSAHASAMAGYVVPTWYGRNRWGGLKYWLTTPGRYSLAEAFYLNQQDMLHQIDSWDPELCRKPFPYGPDGFAEEDLEKASEVAGRELTIDELGFFFDRDVLAFYGDPAWNVRLKELPEENDFTVTASTEGGQYVLTVTTSENFSAERMAGSHFKEEHVKDLPFSYFFPERLKNPRLAEGETWDAAVDENFLLIYNPGFEPGRSYTIRIDTDK